MYYQNEKGFYGYHYDILGEMITVYYYSTLEDFFRCHSEFYINNIIVNQIFKHITAPINNHYISSYATSIYDECGNLYTKDRLIGLYRQWARKRDAEWIYPWKKHSSNGKRRKCYGGYRKIRTFQERKMWFDVDDEYKVRGRAKRSKANLANSWNDYYRHTEKCWKYQRKTKYQYK